jgi:MFS family permease
MGLLRFEHLILAAMVQGVSNSFTMPARQALIPEIVGTARLTNAFGLNVFTMNVTRLAAPALAGVLIAIIGSGWVFTVMAGLYVFAVVAMFKVPKVSALRAERAAAAASGQSANGAAVPARRSRMEKIGVRDVQDAFRYLKTQRVLWMLLLVHMFLSILSMPYQRLLPGFVDDVLSSSPEETAVRMGLLLAMTAVGALIGSLIIASLPNRNRGKLLIGSMMVFALALLAFSASEVLWVSALFVIVLGIGQSGRQSLNNVLIQTHVSNEYRGRISSIMLLEDGIESLGIFAIALAAAAFGVQVALAGTAIGMLVLAVLLWFGTPVYRRLQ